MKKLLFASLLLTTFTAFSQSSGMDLFNLAKVKKFGYQYDSAGWYFEKAADAFRLEKDQNSEIYALIEAADCWSQADVYTKTMVKLDNRALANLAKAKQVAKKAKSDSLSSRIFYLQSRVYLNRGILDSTIYCLQQSLTSLRKSNDELAKAHIYECLGYACFINRNNFDHKKDYFTQKKSWLDQSEQNYLKSLKTYNTLSLYEEEANTLYSLGIVAKEKNDYVKADEYFISSKNLYEKLYGTKSANAGFISGVMAIESSFREDTTESREKILKERRLWENAFEIQKSTEKPNMDGANYLAFLYRSSGSLRDTIAFLSYYQKYLENFERNYKVKHRAIPESYIRFANMKNYYTNEKDTTRMLIENAFNSLVKLTPFKPDMGYTFGHLTNYYLRNSDYPKAEKFYKLFLQYNEKAFNNYGEIYTITAYSYGENAGDLDAFESYLNGKYKGEEKNINLALVNEARGNREKAIEMLQSSKDQILKKGYVNSMTLGEIYFHIGRNYFAIQKYQEAYNFIFKAAENYEIFLPGSAELAATYDALWRIGEFIPLENRIKYFGLKESIYRKLQNEY